MKGKISLLTYPGHGGWVTKILVGERKTNDDRTEEFLASSSRGKYEGTYNQTNPS